MKNTIGLNISKLREEKRYSVNQLSKLLNCSVQAIYDYEKGRSNPPAEKINKLCEIFKVSSSVLFGEYTEHGNLTDHEAMGKALEINTPLTAESFSLLKHEFEVLRLQYDSEIAFLRKQIEERNDEIRRLGDNNDKLLAK